MRKHPPDTFAGKLEDLENEVAKLQQPSRWIMECRLRTLRRKMTQARDRSLAEWFRRHW